MGSLSYTVNSGSQAVRVEAVLTDLLWGQNNHKISVAYNNKTFISCSCYM